MPTIELARSFRSRRSREEPEVAELQSGEGSWRLTKSISQYSKSQIVRWRLEVCTRAFESRARIIGHPNSLGSLNLDQQPRAMSPWVVCLERLRTGDPAFRLVYDARIRMPNPQNLIIYNSRVITLQNHILLEMDRIPHPFFQSLPAFSTMSSLLAPCHFPSHHFLPILALIRHIRTPTYTPTSHARPPRAPRATEPPRFRAYGSNGRLLLDAQRIGARCGPSAEPTNPVQLGEGGSFGCGSQRETSNHKVQIPRSMGS